MSFRQAGAIYRFRRKTEKKRQHGNSPNSLETGDTAALSPILDIASKYIFPAKVIAGKMKLFNWSDIHDISTDFSFSIFLFIYLKNKQTNKPEAYLQCSVNNAQIFQLKMTLKCSPVTDFS